MPRRGKRAPIARPPIPVTLISDATGSLGRHVLQSLFTQFSDGAFALDVIKFVRTETDLQACLARLERTAGIVVHATIYPAFKKKIESVCRRRKLPVYDLTGPIMAFFLKASRLKPEMQYRKLHALDPQHFLRVDSIEFAMAHDDGAGLATLHEAEMVLTGVSRTSKTPTCMHLALSGYRAANVPLIPGMAPPEPLLALSPARVVCLLVHPDQLSLVRAARAKAGYALEGEYTDAQAIRRELGWSRRLAGERGWATLDVTGRAVEETASHVVDLCGLRKN